MRASGRSTLLMHSTTGILRASALRSTKRVCGSGPSLGVDEQHDAVDHRQAALDLATEVGVAGGVDDVDRHAVGDAGVEGRLPGVPDGGVLREDRDALLALEVTAVHGPLGDVVVLAERPGLPQHLVDEGGLAVVDVGDDGDVTEVDAVGDRHTHQSLRYCAQDRIGCNAPRPPCSGPSQAAGSWCRRARPADGPPRRICWGLGSHLDNHSRRAGAAAAFAVMVTRNGGRSGLPPVAGPNSGARPGRPERSHIQARFIDDAQAEGADRPRDGGRPHRDGLRPVRARVRYRLHHRQLHRQGHLHLRRRRRPQGVRPLLRHRRRDLPGHPPDAPGPPRRQGGQRRRAARAGRELDPVGGRPHLDVQAQAGREVLRRRAVQRRGRLRQLRPDVQPEGCGPDRGRVLGLLLRRVQRQAREPRCSSRARPRTSRPRSSTSPGRPRASRRSCRSTPSPCSRRRR